VETWEFFSKTAGEAYVTKVDAFQTRSQSVMNNYLDTRSASFEKRARVDLLDLKEQREGEMHIFFKSKIVRAKTFYANPAPVKKMRLNQFLKVEPPPTRILHNLETRLEKFNQTLKSKDYIENFANKNNADLAELISIFNAHAELEPIDRSVSTLMALHEHVEPEQVESESVEELAAETELNIFTPLRITDHLDRFILNRSEEFKKQIIDKKITFKGARTIERLLGKNDKQSSNIANEVVNDIQVATYYPPIIFDAPEVDQISATVDDVIGKIHTAREKAEKDKKDEKSSD
ncbi:MAG: phosphoesterase, partial [Pseudomonadota bacterium]